MNEPAVTKMTTNERASCDGTKDFSIFPRTAWLSLPDVCWIRCLGRIRGIVSVPISVAYVRRLCAGMACGNIIHSFAVGVPFNDSNN